MSVRMIGAGFGRTGTNSIKLTLERLGLDPCHHMAEVFAHPEEVPHWHAAARGEAVDWRALLAPYRATIDWPSSHFWRELAAAYPDARVLLTVRDPEAWWRSFSKTILPSIAAGATPPIPGWLEMARRLIFENTFGGRPDDRDHAIAVFERNTAAVKAEIPAERLVVYEIGEGWEPLCAALDLPVPDEPFPRINDTAQFQQSVEKATGYSFEDVKAAGG